MSREERQQERRSVSYYFDDEDGSLMLKARLPAEAGMQLLKALEAAMPGLPLPKAGCVDPGDVRCGRRFEREGTARRSRTPPDVPMRWR